MWDGATCYNCDGKRCTVCINHSDYVCNELYDEFIQFAKTEYGLTVKAVESDTPDSFEKLFGVPR